MLCNIIFDNKIYNNIIHLYSDIKHFPIKKLTFIYKSSVDFCISSG